MDAIFNVIDIIVAIIGPLSDFLWEFPTNFEWYANIPVLGEFSFSTILLVGSGILFHFSFERDSGDFVSAGSSCHDEEL